MLSKSAVDRGLFVSTYFRTYKEQNNKNHSNGEEEFFTKPETKGMKSYNYSKLQDDGFVPENTFVNNGDIIIGKCMPNKNGSTITYKDNSIPFKNSEIGFIDRNCYNDKYFPNTNGDGYTFTKVRIRNDRFPTIGDKFSSRSGQKGTCGILYNQEDMPFTKDGITPDIIMNPHAIPSRMTIGQLIECVMGKACTLLGTYGDATPFNEVSVEEIGDILESMGMERYGNEIMYNSRTGEQMSTDIFIGPTYYQRLKHMTTDKIHCYMEDTEILTDKGWVFFEDLTKEHKVASMVDDALVYQYPSEIQVFDYEGKMYAMETDQINIVVTPNHRMYVRTHKKNTPYKMPLAEDMYGTRKCWKKNVDIFVPDLADAPEELVIKDGVVTHFSVPGTDLVFEIGAWLTFYGIWIAEGHVNKDDFSIRIAANKPRVKEALIEIEKIFNYTFHKHKDRSTEDDYNRWTFYNAAFGRYMLQFSVGSTNKFLADWVWYLDREQCTVLIEGMCLGDGCKQKKGAGNWTYTTSSTRLADDFQRLCLHAGVSCNKRLHSEAGASHYSDKLGYSITSTVDSWQLSINTSKNEPCLNHRPHNPRQDKWVDYDGKVYCCTVPEGEGVIYVRRKGIGCWSGNSRSNNGPLVLLTRQPSDGRLGRGEGGSAFAKHTLMREPLFETCNTIQAAKAA